MNGYASSARCALPDETLDAARRVAARGARGVPGVRPVPREHLHVTLAFLGAPPGRRARRRSPARCARPPQRRRAVRALACAATARRAASACSSSTTRAAARRRSRPTSTSGSSARRLRARAAAVAAARHRRCASASAPRLRPALPDARRRSCRPTRLLTCLGCAPAGRSTKSSNPWQWEVDNGGPRAGSRHRARPDRAPVRQGLGDAHERPGPGVRSARSRPARSRSTSRSGSAGCRAAASSRSSARSRRARRRSSTT